ncbi:sel1 repeat family protein [Aeromonas caviae]|uniref:Sel1 repeat family protein n=1 Tax=Aeromonas caviae TaxID=648 RepID=A0AA42R7N5_AERCA|nr:sel1 repeat family protein [Aeromonas caviae]MDH0435443.1 sel1 repeat family protein [Aeromonas caviae]MDH0938288.1 sel1 repeat family protein [Aeromonas caviae]MDH1399121.1 sel1 repeat family protein [Aeromonas caviae]MDH1505177.1 sel1 repeat family protein [Aeromonas caviae]MDH1806292.1 sel1 repeat family protein [Aeromonas caviae]
MMKPRTLIAIIGVCSLPLQGAESTSAAAPTQAVAAAAAPPSAASAPLSPASSSAQPALTPASSVATPSLPVSAVPAQAPSASAPVPSAPAAAPLPRATTQASAAAGELQAVPLYRQDELLNWIEQGRHLARVKQDRCQLTQDIEARASVMKIPAYQFLWGDMLAWGVCTKPDAQIGVQYMWEAANQGLAPALEQLGRYYWKGILVQKDLVRAETLMREAASLGFLRAQMEWVEMLLQGMGSPLDYEEAYHWLHGAVIGDKAMHQKAASLLSRLGNRMPANAIARAKAMH